MFGCDLPTGQMSSKKLETIIEDFYDHKFDVLISTNIVENGIDISKLTNTMIINRADHFGLAELHQLRGRVGRSDRKAFCYLITPDIKSLTDDARKRLLALEEFSDLGSGFNIAMRDLDIRGAGDILGAEQSGFINERWALETRPRRFSTYAVKELKEQEFSDVFSDVEVEIELPETQVEFDLPALLESDYVSDNVERLEPLPQAGRRRRSRRNREDWKEEVKDRFGPIPDATQNLITASVIKLYASRLFFTKARIRSNRMWLEYALKQETPDDSGDRPDSGYGKSFQSIPGRLIRKMLKIALKSSRKMIGYALSSAIFLTCREPLNF
ncbi:MAG: helicase-related protein [Fodinibius sp.]|nr:helicase-related protein [Fodinibius sp.]